MERKTPMVRKTPSRTPLRQRRSAPSFAAGLALTLAFVAAPAQAETAIAVTSLGDAGPGTLRAALSAAATADGPVRIVLPTDAMIEIETTLIYSGRAPIEIFGRRATVFSRENFTLLAVTEGADLAIQDLTFTGPNSYTITNRPTDTPPGKGVFVEVRDDQTGLVRLALRNVGVFGVAGHGVHVSDCDRGDACGLQEEAGGSPASVLVEIDSVTINQVGHGGADQDGLRVDERGPGRIEFHSYRSQFIQIGGDAVALDEGDWGDVLATSASDQFGAVDQFGASGGYCDPAVLTAFLPDPAEGAFEDGVRRASDIPGPDLGSPDDACFQRTLDRYDSDYVKAFEIAIDVEDGLDIDEAGPGRVTVMINRSWFPSNQDKGVEIDEAGDGGLHVLLIEVMAQENRDDGVTVSESGAGDLTGGVFGGYADDNGGRGFVFEEAGDGDLRIDVNNTLASGNGAAAGGGAASGGDEAPTGVEATQAGAGAGRLIVRGDPPADGIAVDGVVLREE